MTEEETRLREYVDRRLADMDLRYQQRFDSQQKALEAARQADAKAVEAALTAAEKAVIKAETASEKRFESVNEFRAQLSDQANTFVPRLEAAAQRDAILDQIRRLDELVKLNQIWQGNITGRMAMAGGAFAVLMTVIVFAANYLTRAS